jgi:stringent starvation protein B
MGKMTSSRSYLLRALYDWIVDNECTPYVLINAMLPEVQVPQQHVKDGQIVLNVSPLAVKRLSIDKDALSFNARFGGVETDIYAPIPAIMGIYARENGQGMIFESEEFPEPQPPKDTKKPRKPSLKVVK